MDNGTTPPGGYVKVGGRWPQEAKDHALELIAGGLTVTQTARELLLSTGTVSGWVRKRKDPKTCGRCRKKSVSVRQQWGLCKRCKNRDRPVKVWSLAEILNRHGKRICLFCGDEFKAFSAPQVFCHHRCGVIYIDLRKMKVRDTEATRAPSDPPWIDYLLTHGSEEEKGAVWLIRVSDASRGIPRQDTIAKVRGSALYTRKLMNQGDHEYEDADKLDDICQSAEDWVEENPPEHPEADPDQWLAAFDASDHSPKSKGRAAKLAVRCRAQGGGKFNAATRAVALEWDCGRETAREEMNRWEEEGWLKPIRSSVYTLAIPEDARTYQCREEGGNARKWTTPAERVRAVHELHAQGLSEREIVKRLGVPKTTVHRDLKATLVPVGAQAEVIEARRERYQKEREAYATHVERYKTDRAYRLKCDLAKRKRNDAERGIVFHQGRFVRVDRDTGEMTSLLGAPLDVEMRIRLIETVAGQPMGVTPKPVEPSPNPQPTPISEVRVGWVLRDDSLEEQELVRTEVDV